MKNIDLKARLRNKALWVYMGGVVVTTTQLLGVKIFSEDWAHTLNLIIGALVGLGVLVDNSTKGLADSNAVNSEEVE